jgi:acid phosphatase
MFMLCGYETVIKGRGKSEFCKPSLFDTEDWKNFEYFNDLIYHKMVGYASPVAPFLGVPWLNTSTHNILSANGREGDHPHYNIFKDPDLPGPGGSPNSTHTQKLFAYFTHREEPPIALVALGIWNQTKVGPMSLERRGDDRVWRTSHVLPFLGHVAIERIGCDDKKDYVRTIVNGAVQKLDHCKSGPGSSCPIQQFADFVAARVEEYGDIEGACKAEE